MDRAPQLASAPRVVRILHIALIVGLVLSGATLYLVRRVLQRPSVEDAPVLTLVLAAVAIVLLVLAVGALRPRVPERRVRLRGIREDSGSIYYSRHYFLVDQILEIRPTRTGECPSAAASLSSVMR